jgi:hypothetical protein
MLSGRFFSISAYIPATDDQFCGERFCFLLNNAQPLLPLETAFFETASAGKGFYHSISFKFQFPIYHFTVPVIAIFTKFDDLKGKMVCHCIILDTVACDLSTFTWCKVLLSCIAGVVEGRYFIGSFSLEILMVLPATQNAYKVGINNYIVISVLVT